MAEPLNVTEQLQSNPFMPTKMIVVLFAATNFDAVHKL